MPWWYWILIGLLLLAGELLTPGGFYVLFFGIAALGVGVTTVLGLTETTAVQCLVFSATAIGSLLVFRKRLVDFFAPKPSDREVDSLRAQTATLSQDLPANGIGRAELRGASWTVRNTEARELKAGQRCTVERVEGLTLWVKGE